MSGTYKATGINLKGMAFGESDRLLTVLTPEYGLIRVVAPGSRKHQSSLRGRSGLFVINDLLIAKGKSLDKIVQAEGLESFPGLSQDLQKLTASQYLAELALYQALTDQPQEELFSLLRSALSRLEQLPSQLTLPCLLHATFHLLTLAGVTPQVHACCVTQEALVPDLADPNWRVGFSTAVGGTVTLAELERMMTQGRSPSPEVSAPARPASRETAKTLRVAEPAAAYRSTRSSKNAEYQSLNASQLALLQHLTEPDFIQPDGTLLQPSASALPPADPVWLSIERLLRQYAEYHFERPIRSAALIDTCFLSLPQPLSS